MFVGAAVTGFMVTRNHVVDDVINDFSDEESEPTWHRVAEWRPSLLPLGEATPSGGNGVLSVFLLDYGIADISVLGNNATDWSASGDVHAYADSDGFSEDAPSEKGFYIVVRARFTKDVCYNNAKSMFEGNRTKCTITVSGDETFTATHYCNLTDGTGGGVASTNESDGDALFVNFYFDWSIFCGF